MPTWFCATCGVQYGSSETAPAECPICLDERQYTGANGQQWTTTEQLARAHHNRFENIEPNLIGIGTEPTFAIGQRALLVRTPQGNILWECTPLLGDTTIELVRALGGIQFIALSHPHLVSACVDWSRAFGDAPIYWHADDRQWAMRNEGTHKFWEGDSCKLNDAVTLVRCGGHFPGSTVLHWANGADGRGVLLTGDTIMVVSDHRFVSFMYSYPNIIPLNSKAVRRIANSVEPLAFDRIYGSWWHSIIPSDAKGAVRRSADRYISAIHDS